ncbi:cytochrome b N-terminal domain-containing protein [candidate division KSB1 bacterium]|nr:cytochrome b N-terminal domain-containing protein [candidate division KSB1 bacterium]
MNNKGLKTFFDNIKGLKKSVTGSIRRYAWPPKSARERSQAIFQNFFLHIQSARVHKYSLKPMFTMGLGLMTFFLFIILCVTGLFLMIYYNPTIALAYDNVRDISFVVATGKYMRNLHRWAAHAMVVTVMLHMARVFYTSSYKRARKFNWVIGMGLFLTTLLLSYTGYLLPWDQLAYWAVTIGANIAASPRELTDAIGITSFFDIGGLIKNLLIGGNIIAQEALTRFYLFHVILLPVVCFVLIGVHFWRIRKDGGISRPDNADEIIEREENGVSGKAVTAKKVFEPDPGKTYGLMALIKGKSPQLNGGPDHTVMTWPVGIWAEVGVFMLTLSVMTVLAYFFDAPLKEIANPGIPENPAKAPWYFLGLQELISYSAFMGGIGVPTIVIIGLVFIPYLDKEDRLFGVWFSGRDGKKIAIKSLIFSSVFTILLLAFTVRFGWLRSWFSDISQLWIVFVNPGSLIVLAYAWWSLHILRNTASTRMAAIALFTSFLTGFLILTVMGSYFRGPNWEFFWSPSQWPNH